MKCCGICPDGCVLAAAADQERRTLRKERSKPRVSSDVDEQTFRTWGGDFIRHSIRVLWRVSCPCHYEGEVAFQVVPSWEAALEIALTHWKEQHA